MRLAGARRVLVLGGQELRSLLRDPVLLAFILYAFTVYVATAGGGLSLEVRDAAVAVADADRSATTRRILRAVRPPEFRPPRAIEPDRIADALESGRYTFVLDIPRGFERDLVSGEGARLQVHVDATAVSQAFLGAAHLTRVVGRAAPSDGAVPSEAVAPEARVRVRFNPNREGSWHVSVVELLFVVTLLSMVLPAASLLREREQGTTEHLLSMPIRPLELMLGKVWANGLVVLTGTALSVLLIVQGLFGAPFRGSWALFLLGTLLYQLATAGLGIVLATLARNVAQVALLSLLVVSPIMFLSGIWTPLESMPPVLQRAASLSPLRYYGELCLGVVFRGAGLDLVWPELLATAALGTALFSLGALRFRERFAAGGS